MNDAVGAGIYPGEEATQGARVKPPGTPLVRRDVALRRAGGAGDLAKSQSVGASPLPQLPVHFANIPTITSRTSKNSR